MLTSYFGVHEHIYNILESLKVVLCCLFFLVLEFRLRFTLCVFILFVVRFGLLSGHLLERAAHSVDHMFSCILAICNFSYFRFWFLGLDLGSDCFSSWSVHTYYFYQP